MVRDKQGTEMCNADAYKLWTSKGHLVSKRLKKVRRRNLVDTYQTIRCHNPQTTI